MSYTFRNGVPLSLTQRTTPYLEQDGAHELGIFAQDQWRFNRVTFNYGLRFDYVNGYVPAQNLPGQPNQPEYDDGFPGVPRLNPWVGERSFPKITGIPNWKDQDPRLGFAWDRFGNNRTALKVSLGRFVAKTNVDVAVLLNPITTTVNAANRSWTDTNQNYVPDCNLGNYAANGECGPLDNQFFGSNNPSAVRWSDTVRDGWGVRDHNWEFGTELQHEITRGLSVNAGHYRNTGGYFRNTDSAQRVNNNLAVGPADLDQFCVTAPRDPRLPQGGGYQICCLSNVKPEKFGQFQLQVDPASDFGKDTRVNDFFGAGLNARLAKGIRIGGGFDAQRSVKDQCFVVDSPSLTTFVPGAFAGAGFVNASFGPQTTTTIDGQQTCRITTPITAQMQLKLNWSVPLPKGFVVRGVFQDSSGAPIEAVYAASTADAALSLGRNLAGGARTVNVPLVLPQTMYEDRIRRLDLRLSKSFQLRDRVNLQVNLDACNALNSSAIQSINSTFGPSWLSPTAILDPRIFQLSGQLRF